MAQFRAQSEKALGWPEELCNAVPARVRRKALKGIVSPLAKIEMEKQ